ncbi:DUF3427 domain-containing protein [Propionibacteriaceae bacterium G1746]|uniref:DUF3427 domain-containing protein n=1 Tax=Aestuariimicrobium sp. G57 TaxID=3418485 RepID=UPI003C2537D5
MTAPDAAPLPEGAYDAIVTSEVETRLHHTLMDHQTSKIDEAHVPEVLARHVQSALQQHLSTLKAEQRVSVTNELLTSIGAVGDIVFGEPSKLVSVRPAPGPNVKPRHGDHPVLPLSDVALLTNTGSEPNFGHEIRGEIASADEVYLICAFIKWHGIRTLENQLRELAERGATFRVITSTYLGSTERRALDRLVREFGAQVRISYEIERTRLHAKAWLFHRDSHFDTAYVGSSNLTSTALLDGVEWNVRLSRSVTPSLLKKFGATFDTYWNSENFEEYLPDRDGDRLDTALAEARGGGSTDRVTISLSGLEVRPYPHQRYILEALEVERTVHDHHRNLVVAATGTGKTVVAALDYRAMCLDGQRPSLLFVAHRKEILQQALRTYREVLNDPTFGELYVGGERPSDWQHVFASVQSLSSDVVSSMTPAAFEVVVIDEFHHAAASSYQQLLTHLTPRELLGLTATPERTDGIDVRKYFDGRTAAEIRLWDALDAELLVPFHYFGVSDGTDLTQISWRTGRYDPAELENLYTANTTRLRIILKQLEDKVPDLGAMRALGFCSGVAHAKFMADAFNQAGIPAAAVSGDTPPTERADALRDLTARKLNIVFSADVFNEGLDLPDVDTVLFLRPTESGTLFLQQLGRGLRRTRDKAVLTVLDFVGNHRKEYRFDARLTAMTGIPRGQLRDHVTREFPELPAGSQLILDRHTQQQVLSSLKRQITTRWAESVSALRNLGDVSLTRFVEATDTPVSQLLKADKSWTRLRRDAGLSAPPGGPYEEALMKRVRFFAHVEDREREEKYRALLTGTEPYSHLSPVDQIWARMLLFSLWPGLPFSNYEEPLQHVRDEPAVVSDILEMMAFSVANATHAPESLGGALSWRPLRSHMRYTREELCAALDYASLERKPDNFREGVFYSKTLSTDAFLVTINKAEAKFSPTTMYEDYAISPTLFHWETQSRTTVASPTGQRYLNQRQNGGQVLIFMREQGTTEFGQGAPYLLLGEADYVQHQGDRPIAITWQLRRPMPQDQFALAAVTSV